MENCDRSFSRWLKIFDTFPEGMAIVKDDGSIMYSNNSLAKLLEYETQPNVSASHYSQVGVKSDPAEQTQKMLQNVKIKKYEQQENETFERPLASDRNAILNNSVWDFITKNSTGATYEVTNAPGNAPSAESAFKNFNKVMSSPEQPKLVGEGLSALVQHSDEEAKVTIDKGLNDQSNIADNTEERLVGDNPALPLIAVEPDVRPTRYLSFDQIKVGMVGPMEKIFIARDESFIVTLRELEMTRRHMIKFTQNMMCMVDDYAIITGQTLKELMQTSLSQKQSVLLEDCLNGMRQARYSIRDF